MRHLPGRRVELHFHLLPGVDDGPADMDEALEMARMAIADGTGLVVATTHIRDLDDVGTLPDRAHELRAALAAARIPLQVECGGEVAWDDVPHLSDADLELIAHGPTGRRWVLFETPLFGPAGDEFRAAAAELVERGFAMLVAHPERTPELFEGPGAASAGLGAAAPFPRQLNATSLTGLHGHDARERALALVRRGEADVISSDAHRPSRGPHLGLAVAELRQEGVDPRAAERMVADTPRRLLEEGIALARAA